jgi:zinc-binding in reverse transcriptase
VVEDKIIWRWSSTGLYSSKSFYDVISVAGRERTTFMWIWKARVTPTVKVFALILLKGRLLTRDVMAKRNMMTTGECVMCHDCLLESAIYLFFTCQYDVWVWSSPAQHYNYRFFMTGTDISAIMERSWERTTPDRYKLWATTFLATVWALWRERNRCIFQGKGLSAQILVARIIKEVQLWLKHC